MAADFTDSEKLKELLRISQQNPDVHEFPHSHTLTSFSSWKKNMNAS